MVDVVIVSRKETQLIEDVERALSEVGADVIRASLAIYISRLGNYARSENIVNEIRVRNYQFPSIERSVWINLADGIRLYFQNFGTAKSDGVQRAYAIASAAGLYDLQALSSAWLAQWSYSDLDMKVLASHLRVAFSLSKEDSHATLARANLVGAQALHYGGRSDLAKPWYKRATYHAATDGDDLSISAVMHNNVWLQMLNLRQVVLTGEGSLDVGRYLDMSADSNETFDGVRQDHSWQNLKVILRAQIFSLNGRFSEALELYENSIGVDNSTIRLEANTFADFGRCYAETGNTNKSEEYIELALKALTDSTNIDDRAATHSLSSIVFRAVGRKDDAKIQQELADNSWSLHKLNQDLAVALIQELGSLAR